MPSSQSPSAENSSAATIPRRHAPRISRTLAAASSSTGSIFTMAPVQLSLYPKSSR